MQKATLFFKKINVKLIFRILLEKQLGLNSKNLSTFMIRKKRKNLLKWTFQLTIHSNIIKNQKDIKKKKM